MMCLVTNDTQMLQQIITVSKSCLELRAETQKQKRHTQRSNKTNINKQISG